MTKELKERLQNTLIDIVNGGVRMLNSELEYREEVIKILPAIIQNLITLNNLDADK